MAFELIEPLAAGAGGSMLGVLLAYWGLKTRLDSFEKALQHFVTDKEFSATVHALTQRIDNSVARFNRVDTNLEVMLKILMDDRLTRKQHIENTQERGGQ